MVNETTLVPVSRRLHLGDLLLAAGTLLLLCDGDVLEYMQGLQHKQQVYRDNGIPAMFVYPQDLTGPLWPDRLYRRIESAGQQSLRRQGYVHAEPARQM